jgi:hypothetical protein
METTFVVSTAVFILKSGQSEPASNQRNELPMGRTGERCLPSEIRLRDSHYAQEGILRGIREIEFCVFFDC